MSVPTTLSVRERAKSGSGQARHRRQLSRLHAVKKITSPGLSPATVQRLHNEAISHPHFADMTEVERQREVNQRIADYLLWNVPNWFGHTPDADAKAHELTRDHDIAHGLIKAAPLTTNQIAALERRKQERLDREQRLATRLEELSNAQPTATA